MINTLLINIHLLLYWHHFLQLKYLFVSNMTAWWQSKQEYIINMMGWGVSEGVKRQNKKVSRCVMARLGHNTFSITRFFSNRADTYFPGKYAFLDSIFWTNFRLALILRISKLIVNEKICRYFFEWRKKKYLYIYIFFNSNERFHGSSYYAEPSQGTRDALGGRLWLFLRAGRLFAMSWLSSLMLNVKFRLWWTS